VGANHRLAVEEGRVHDAEDDMVCPWCGEDMSGLSWDAKRGRTNCRECKRNAVAIPEWVFLDSPIWGQWW
jgi:hypothetical protein